MAKFNKSTATVNELRARIQRYTDTADQKVREDQDSPAEKKQIENLLLCAADLRAELARRGES